MVMKMRIINNDICTEALKQAVLDDNGHIKVLPAAEWMSFGWDTVRLFMHEYPIYVLPTRELIDRLAELITPYKKPIEIGAGTGNIGRNLGITMTDSHLQERADIKKLYEIMKQPVIRYPCDVWRGNANLVVRVMKPDCVLGCYVTHYSEQGAGNSWGVDFTRIVPRVKCLILVGNKETHGENPIMELPHEEIELPAGLITRAGCGGNNRIYVWRNITKH